MSVGVELAQRIASGDPRALARAISIVERGGPEAESLMAVAFKDGGAATIVGFTGPPGAGKSTLISAVVGRERAAGRTVAVLSVDPSSPLGDGALLGDRVRLRDHFLDPGVFIRSMATRGALGGLAEATGQALTLLDAAGYDTILLETVGVGQSEVDVIHHAESVVLVLVPGAGDSIQAIKSGVMEIPDVIAVNKFDLPGALNLVRDVRAALSLRPPQPWKVPIVRTSSVDAQGIDRLRSALDRHRAHLCDSGGLTLRRRRRFEREVATITTALLRREVEARLGGEKGTAVLEEVVARRLDPRTAAGLLSRSFLTTED